MTQNNNNANTPMNMATNARDKLQASAREWMRNLEEVMSKKNSNVADTSAKEVSNPLETVIRTMFGSCTSGADVVDSPGSDQVENSSASRSNSHISSPRSVANQSSGSEEEVPPSKQDKDIGEHIYAQLFFDDQARASKAVNSLHLRDHDVGAKHTDRISPKQKNVPKPFHVSSPRRGISPARPVATAPLSSEELNIPANQTFDDSLSAISAHTLEAMARMVGPSRSDVTKGSRDSSVFEDVHEKRETLGANCSPFGSPNRLARSRSNQTWGSKNSTPTVNTKSSQSTRTTESSSFEHMWHREEKKYWEEECNEQPLHADPNALIKESRIDARSKSSRGRSSRNTNKSRKSKQGSTLSTVSSSAHSEWTSQFDNHHPHDTFHFESSDGNFAVFQSANPAFTDEAEI